MDDPIKSPRTPKSPTSATTRSTRGPEDYQHLRYLGKGALGCVVLVQEKVTGKKYAMKMI